MTYICRQRRLYDFLGHRTHHLYKSRRRVYSEGAHFLSAIERRRAQLPGSDPRSAGSE